MEAKGVSDMSNLQDKVINFIVIASFVLIHLKSDKFLTKKMNAHIMTSFAAGGGNLLCYRASIATFSLLSICVNRKVWVVIGSSLYPFNLCNCISGACCVSWNLQIG